MATVPTDLEVLAKQQESLVKEVEELRQKAETEERKLLERQQAASVKSDVNLLEAEKARLQARLEAAKEASKEFTASLTPAELAENARNEAVAPAPAEKKE